MEEIKNWGQGKKKMRMVGGVGAVIRMWRLIRRERFYSDLGEGSLPWGCLKEQPVQRPLRWELMPSVHRADLESQEGRELKAVRSPRGAWCRVLARPLKWAVIAGFWAEHSDGIWIRFRKAGVQLGLQGEQLRPLESVTKICGRWESWGHQSGGKGGGILDSLWKQSSQDFQQIDLGCKVENSPGWFQDYWLEHLS